MHRDAVLCCGVAVIEVEFGKVYHSFEASLKVIFKGYFCVRHTRTVRDSDKADADSIAAHAYLRHVLHTLSTAHHNDGINDSRRYFLANTPKIGEVSHTCDGEVPIPLSKSSKRSTRGSLSPACRETQAD